MGICAAKLSIPRMPALWDKEEIVLTHRDVAAALAHWAVAQSPYTVPENLGSAILEFMGNWLIKDYEVFRGDLRKEIRATIEKCPLIVAWNTPKLEGAVNPELNAAFISRYDQIKPDYDFIDLDALAQNVAHEIVLWAQVHAAQDALTATWDQ